MKRLKIILLVSIMACLIGCQRKNTIAIPLDEYIDENIVENNETTDTEGNQDVFVSAFEVGTPEYLFEQFLRGEIDAEILYPENDISGQTINISDLIFNPEEWCFEAFYEGEHLDLDNDGENELILDGPYGGMYLDAIDGKLYVFAKPIGNAGSLDYTYYEGAYWIVIKDTTHGGRLWYNLFKYEGGDNLVDSMTLIGLWNSEDDKEFTFNGEQITEEEFNKIHDELFASKTPVNQTNYNLSEEEFFKLVSFLVFLEEYDGLPEDTKGYEIVYNLGEKVDNYSSGTDDHEWMIASHRMLTSDLNIFFKDVLQIDKKYDAGYRSISEAGIICNDDGYTYAYNGAGWAEYAVVKSVTKKSDSIEIEADIINGFDESTISTIKFTLKVSDNIFGYIIDRKSISVS